MAFPLRYFGRSGDVFCPFGGALSEILLSFDASFALPCAVLQNFFWGAGQSCKKNGNTVKWGCPIQDNVKQKAEVPEMLLCSFSLKLGGIGVSKHNVI